MSMINSVRYGILSKGKGKYGDTMGIYALLFIVIMDTCAIDAGGLLTIMSV